MTGCGRKSRRWRLPYPTQVATEAEPQQTDRRSSAWGGFRDALPLAFVVGVFGISYGILAVDAGFGKLAPLVMSLTTFGGSAQFAAVSVIGSGGAAAAATLAAVLLNTRYLAIGFSISPYLSGGPLNRFLGANLVVDESWAVAMRPDGSTDRARLLGAGLAIYVFWAAGTVIGVVGGDVLGDPKDLGLDAAFPALFLALVAPMVRDKKALLAAVLGAAIAIALVPLVRPGIPIVAAASVCLIGWKRR